MPETLETILAIEVFASTIVVLLLLYFAVKYRKELTSEKAKQELAKRKRIFWAAFFFGVVALAVFLIWEIFEALEVLNMISVEEGVDNAVAVFQVFVVLIAQSLMFYLQAEVRKHAAG